METEAKQIRPIVKPEQVKTVVFDAMGVLYQDGDDIREILMPLLRSKGNDIPAFEVDVLYDQAKVGVITSREFFHSIGLQDMTDAEYCKRYKLTFGVHETIEALKERGYRIAVLSNDLKEWSKILRRQFHLEEIIPTWVISGDIGVGKPDPRAFAILCETLDEDPQELLFVDDTTANLVVAQDEGFHVVQFGEDPEGIQAPPHEDGTKRWPTVKTMSHLLELL